METPLIISFFTKDTIYEKEVEELIESCNLLHLDFIIEEKKISAVGKRIAAKNLFLSTNAFRNTKDPFFGLMRMPSS